MSTADERLRRILGGDHLGSLRKRMRKRFELAAVDGGVESFRFEKSSPRIDLRFAISMISKSLT